MELSPEQLKNWRNVLTAILGPYALIMPDEEIETIRNRMQAQIDEISQEEEIDD